MFPSKRFRIRLAQSIALVDYPRKLGQGGATVRQNLLDAGLDVLGTDAAERGQVVGLPEAGWTRS